MDGKTVASYLDLLVDLLLVRRLEPWHANVGKRLVKSPRIYVRDSGITHALLGLTSQEDVLGHPVAGASWEGFVIETLIATAPDGTQSNFYRTAAGADVDLLLTFPGRRPWALEIKRSLTPKIDRGFHEACEDLNPERRIVVLSWHGGLSAEERRGGLAIDGHRRGHSGTTLTTDWAKKSTPLLRPRLDGADGRKDRIQAQSDKLRDWRSSSRHP